MCSPFRRLRRSFDGKFLSQTKAAPNLCGVYRAIYERRDIRSRFLPDPIPPTLLGRIRIQNYGPASGKSGVR
jgi:hypothetical protein